MNIKTRLAVMNCLEFAVWGAYLTSMGNYLGKAGMGAEIAWFYAIQGIVSIFMPTIVGIVADKYVQPQRMLGICHLLAGLGMVGLFYLGMINAQPDKTTFIAIYSLSVAFYMPTLALSNTAAFAILKGKGYDTVTDFPPIRVLGTVGFIVTMWFVNCASWDNGAFSFGFAANDFKFQYTHMQFLVSGIISFVLFAYCMTLPACPIVKHEEKKSVSEMLGFSAFKLFKDKKMALFFIFSCLLVMSLQVTNSYATPFITSFKGDALLADTFAANNATLLVSISQVSEALCILMIPFFLRRYGIKIVMLIAMFAWVFRFGLFGLGNPGDRVWMFIISCLVYGVAFDFFNISGSLYVNDNVDKDMRSSAQGLFMLMTNGLGASIGTWAAGLVVNHFVYNAATPDWSTAWYIFAAYSLVVGVLFMILCRNPNKSKK